MRTKQAGFSGRADTLLARLRDRLDSPNPHDRVLAIRHLAAGVDVLERQVLLDAHASGMTWSEIGAAYGVSRQAAHRRFSDDTVVPPDVFESLLDDLESEPEVVPSLARAGKRVRPTTRTR